jgi:hypothetical protein
MQHRDAAARRIYIGRPPVTTSANVRGDDSVTGRLHTAVGGLSATARCTNWSAQ